MGEGFLRRYEPRFMYSDLASPFEELCVNADSAGGKLVLMRNSDDCAAVTVRRALDVSHGKF